MRSEKLEKYILEYDDLLKHFCEVGVYEYNYSRVIKQIEAGKRVTLVECFPRCVQDLREKTKDRPNVTIHDVAIYDSVGEMTMTDVGASAFLNGLDGKTPAHQNGYSHLHFGNFKVKTDTFDKYDDGTIDALFVDIEGAEWYVLKYMKSRPQIIEVETHYDKYKNPHLLEILEWMNVNGYVQLDKTDADTIFVRK